MIRLRPVPAVMVYIPLPFISKGAGMVAPGSWVTNPITSLKAESGLFNSSSATTETVKGTPAITDAGAETLKCVGFTSIVRFPPTPVTVSVTTMLTTPELRNVTKMVRAPWSPAVNVYVGGGVKTPLISRDIVPV